MAAGPGEHAERQTSSWITTGLHESVADLAEFGVPILHPTRTPDEAAARAEAGTQKRAAWRVEDVLGSPLRRRGLWPAE